MRFRPRPYQAAPARHGGSAASSCASAASPIVHRTSGPGCRYDGHFCAFGFLISEPYRKNELEQRAALAVRRRRQPAAVVVDDHSADGQPQPHSLRLCGEECIKYAVQLLGLISRARILDRHDNGLAAAKPCSDLQHPWPSRDGLHGFDRVVHQVESGAPAAKAVADIVGIHRKTRDPIPRYGFRGRLIVPNT